MTRVVFKREVALFPRYLSNKQHVTHVLDTLHVDAHLYGPLRPQRHSTDSDCTVHSVHSVSPAHKHGEDVLDVYCEKQEGRVAQYMGPEATI